MYLFQLVGHIIKGGGIAISGQEQRQLGGGFLEGEGAPQGVNIFTLYQISVIVFKIAS